MKILILYIVSIGLWAIADAERDNGNKHIGHFLKAFMVLFILVVPYYYSGQIEWQLISYLLIHVSLFDVIYNLSRRPVLPITYHGTTGWWDNFMNLLNPPTWAELFGRVVILFTGVMMAIQNL